MPSTSVVVSAVGCHTSMSHASVSFAGGRAGLSRGSSLSNISYRNQNGDTEAVLGHAAASLLGHQGWVRWLSLALLGLEDLLAKVDQQHTGPLRLFLCLPSVDLYPRPIAPLPPPRHLSPLLTSKLLSLCRYGTLLDPAVTTSYGWPGFVTSLNQALDLLGRGGACACIIGAVDSYVDSDSLRWLALNGRLKTSDAPCNLQPGEGAAFLLLRRAEQLAESEKRSSLRLGSVVSAREPDPTRPQGIGFSKSAVEAVSRSGLPLQKPWLISDHNGEPARAEDCGHLLARLRTVWPTVNNMPTDMPAVAFGDCGLARGLLGAGWALCAHQRGWFRGDGALVLATGDGDERITIFLGRV